MTPPEAISLRCPGALGVAHPATARLSQCGSIAACAPARSSGPKGTGSGGGGPSSCAPGPWPGRMAAPVTRSPSPPTSAAQMSSTRPSPSSPRSTRTRTNATTRHWLLPPSPAASPPKAAYNPEPGRWLRSHRSWRHPRGSEGSPGHDEPGRSAPAEPVTTAWQPAPAINDLATRLDEWQSCAVVGQAPP